MIIRIVKMSFLPEKDKEFLKIFSEVKSKIAAFEGCTHLELLRDVKDKNTFFTYSYWDSEVSLNKYRNSELFSTVWEKVKLLFDAKSEAWSLERFN